MALTISQQFLPFPVDNQSKTSNNNNNNQDNLQQLLINLSDTLCSEQHCSEQQWKYRVSNTIVLALLWRQLTLAWQAVTVCYEQFISAGLFQNLWQHLCDKGLHFRIVSEGMRCWVCHIGVIQLPIQICHKKIVYFQWLRLHVNKCPGYDLVFEVSRFSFYTCKPHILFWEWILLLGVQERKLG